MGLRDALLGSGTSSIRDMRGRPMPSNAGIAPLPPISRAPGAMKPIWDAIAKRQNWKHPSILHMEPPPLRAASIAHSVTRSARPQSLNRDLRSALVQAKVYKASGRVTPVQKSAQATVKRGVQGAKDALKTGSKERYRRSGR